MGTTIKQTEAELTALKSQIYPHFLYNTLDLLQQIRDNGGRYIFITNNSSKSVTDYVQKVTGMGIQAGFEDFYTSSQATAMYIRENYPDQTV